MLTNGDLIALFGCSGAIVFAVISAAWHVSGRLSRVEFCVKRLPCQRGGYCQCKVLGSRRITQPQSLGVD